MRRVFILGPAQRRVKPDTPGGPPAEPEPLRTDKKMIACGYKVAVSLTVAGYSVNDGWGQAFASSVATRAWYACALIFQR